eukprot:2277570-Heterocapsa_arctica.AAC.1
MAAREQVYDADEITFTEQPEASGKGKSKGSSGTGGGAQSQKTRAKQIKGSGGAMSPPTVYQTVDQLIFEFPGERFEFREDDPIGIR